MRSRYVLSLLVLIMVLVTGCGSKEIAPEAKAHLEELIGVMQEHSLNRLTIDWDQFRAKVFAKAAGAKSIQGALPAVEEALRLLDDRHSKYLPRLGSLLQVGGCITAPVSRSPVAIRPDVPSTIGYIRVSHFQASSPEADATFVNSTRREIEAADSQGVTGWIVDLRQNTGGNMGPMMVGLSPLLSEGPLGSFIDPTGVKIVWELKDGVVYIDGRTVTMEKEAYRLQSGAPRIAVLTDALTASAGEATAIAFKGQSDVRSFGAPTCGKATANGSFPLSDGGTLILTTAVMADRT